MKFTQTSILSGSENTIELPCTSEELAQGFCRYDGGDLLQDAFSFLDAGQRDFIKFGVTPAEWEAEFPTGEK